ncbi:hypothetical protein BO70DRAFT_431065 [Aspergillus heteromorphus CBS 117.55]|uniref:Uncharacterized protein n=1 Tax=Aspergillus heteromorphus CBS 117.55 TaxID=1448321 RepID=A0A317VQB0_9EURO|nr:uncharacterized protein BO70DRAFT_431065 [Aspergillus heteromorphus CBS 117.55]PWY75088.1 hypothetical protein BO70DRAFT_431065 [Aspergillus heteromorphus CBS 117.55]
MPPTPIPIPIPSFCLSQQSLLDIEHATEIASSHLSTSNPTSASPSTRRTLQATGHALTGIVLVQSRTGLGGRTVGEFGVDSAVTNTKSNNTNSDNNTKGGKMGSCDLRRTG